MLLLSFSIFITCKAYAWEIICCEFKGCSGKKMNFLGHLLQAGSACAVPCEQWAAPVFSLLCVAFCYYFSLCGGVNKFMFVKFISEVLKEQILINLITERNLRWHFHEVALYPLFPDRVRIWKCDMIFVEEENPSEQGREPKTKNTTHM